MGAMIFARVMRLGLVFQRLKTRKPRKLQGYIYADYAGILVSDTMGYMFMVAECLISWNAELQDTAALSTIEVEYMVAVEVSKAALWLRGLVENFGIM